MANSSIQKPTGNSQQLKETDSTFTCEICIESISETQRFKSHGQCKHPFCLDCIAKYVQVQIEDKTGGNILCPGLNCQNQFDPFDFREIISDKLFVEWCDLICEQSIPWSNTSYCPNKKCMEIVVNECGRHVKKSKCPNCKELFCFQCKRTWEEINDNNHECRRNGEIGDTNDVLFMRLMKMKKWVKCAGCGHCVELRGGCKRIVCTRCWTTFCYVCGRKKCSCKCPPHGCIDEEQCPQAIHHPLGAEDFYLAVSIRSPIVCAVVADSCRVSATR